MMSSPVASTIQNLYSTTAQRRIKSPPALNHHHKSGTSSGHPGTESSSLAPSTSSFFVVRPLPTKQVSDSASIISDAETITNHSQVTLLESTTKFQSEGTESLVQFQQESKLKRRVSKMLSPLKGSMANQKHTDAWKPTHSPSRSGFSPTTRGFVDPTIGKVPSDTGVKEGGTTHGNNIGEGGNVSGLLHSIRRRASASLITAANLTLAVPLPQHGSTNTAEEANQVPVESRISTQKPTRKSSTLRKQKSAGPLTTSGVRTPKVMLPETPLLSPMQFNVFSEPTDDGAGRKSNVSEYLKAPARRMHNGNQTSQTITTTSSTRSHTPNDDWTGEWNRPSIREVIEKLRTL